MDLHNVLFGQALLLKLLLGSFPSTSQAPYFFASSLAVTSFISGQMPNWMNFSFFPFST
jgi:hypothetical protein